MKIAKIGATCSECHKSYVVKVYAIDYDNYITNGEFVQDVWPDMTPDEREIIINSRVGGPYYCAPCWDKLFEEDDKYDEDPWPEDTGKDNWRTESPYCQEIILWKQILCPMAQRVTTRQW